MIPSVFSGGGGSVNSDTTIITIMQNTHAIAAGCWYVLYGRSHSIVGNAQNTSNAVNANPSPIVHIAACALARFHSSPTRNTTANGGAMKKNTRCSCTYSDSPCLL